MLHQCLQLFYFYCGFQNKLHYQEVIGWYTTYYFYYVITQMIETLIKNLFSFCTLVLMGYLSSLFYAEQLHSYVCIYVTLLYAWGNYLWTKYYYLGMIRSDLRAIKWTELRKQVQDYFIVICDISCLTFSYMSLFFQTVNNIFDLKIEIYKLMAKFKDNYLLMTLRK